MNRRTFLATGLLPFVMETKDVPREATPDDHVKPAPFGHVILDAALPAFFSGLTWRANDRHGFAITFDKVLAGSPVADRLLKMAHLGVEPALTVRSFEPAVVVESFYVRPVLLSCGDISPVNTDLCDSLNLPPQMRLVEFNNFAFYGTLSTVVRTPRDGHKPLRLNEGDAEEMLWPLNRPCAR